MDKNAISPSEFYFISFLDFITKRYTHNSLKFHGMLNDGAFKMQMSKLYFYPADAFNINFVIPSLAKPEIL